jgi:hypothetical protein
LKNKDDACHAELNLACFQFVDLFNGVPANLTAMGATQSRLVLNCSHRTGAKDRIQHLTRRTRKRSIHLLTFTYDGHVASQLRR